MMQISTMLCACLILITCSRPAKQCVLTSQDNGKRITCRSLQAFQVKLPANFSTGYSWRMAEGDTQLVQLLRSEYKPPEETHLMGAPAEQVFYFLPLRKGNTSIRLLYARSWEKDVAPAETFSITVMIK